jgi:4'-phosphopantetheinyl transferase EntD
MSYTSDSHVSLLQQRFGPEVLCDVVSLDGSPIQLFDEERSVVAGAVDTRRREFGVGRTCAHRLLSSLGFEPEPLLPAADRSPQWPRGAIGSIAHSGQICAVAVARADRLASIGVDVEPDEPLEDELWATVCTDRELAWIDACPRDSRGRTARVLFSAKECAYKCIYPLTHTMLEFQDVEIALARDAGVFWARLRDPSCAAHVPLTLKGFRLHCGESIVTGMALPKRRLTEAS